MVLTLNPLPKISRLEHSYLPCAFAIVSTFAHSPSHLPLRAAALAWLSIVARSSLNHLANHPWSIILPRSVLDHLAIHPWPVCHRTICPRLIPGLHVTDLHVISLELRPFTLSIPVALEVVVIGDQLTNLEVTILIAPYPTIQPARLEKLS